MNKLQKRIAQVLTMAIAQHKMEIAKLEQQVACPHEHETGLHAFVGQMNEDRLYRVFCIKCNYQPNPLHIEVSQFDGDTMADILEHAQIIPPKQESV